MALKVGALGEQVRRGVRARVGVGEKGRGPAMLGGKVVCGRGAKG